MANLILSAKSNPAISITGKKETDHAGLKNLGFEESGHRGFQPALTDEQLKNIEDVVNKEDISNKLQSINEITGDEAEYFSANAMVDWISNVESKSMEYVHSYVDYKVENEQSKLKWSLVKSGEITEDVQEITTSLGGNYKELYVRYVIPTMNPDKTSNFQKGRTFLYAQNNQMIADQGNYFFDDNGNTWAVVYKIKMIGNWCTLTRLFENNEASSQVPYELLSGTASKFGMTSGKKLTEDYISQLRALMYPNTTRLFPSGTTYEIWGIKE